MLANEDQGRAEAAIEAQMDTFIAGFYRAATGAINWDEALAPVHRAFRARAAILQSVDLPSNRIVSLAQGPSVDPAGLDFLRYWHELDPRRAFLLARPERVIDCWWHCNEHFDADFVAKDRFYQHFLAAYGTRYLAATSTLVTPNLLTAFTLELPAERGPLSITERHLIERLGIHVAEALRAYERVRRLAAEALAGHSLLEAFSYPMWLLDAERFILYANAAAKRAQPGVEESSQRLRLQSDRADRRLGECLHSLANGRHGLRNTFDARERLSDAPRWLHLHALEPARVLGVFGDRPLVLATLFDAALMSELDPFALGDLFGLTPTEARVAVLLAEGLTAPQIATRLSCAEATIRSHVRQVLTKLGALRITDAVRVLRQGEALWALPVGSR